DVLCDGAVVGRIMKAAAAPVGTPWLWTLAYGHHEDRTPIYDGAFRTFLRWQGMLSDPANFSIRHALIWFQGPPLLALRARRWPPARASHSRKLWHQLRPSMLTEWAAAAAHHTWAGLQLVEVKLTAKLPANP